MVKELGKEVVEKELETMDSATSSISGPSSSATPAKPRPQTRRGADIVVLWDIPGYPRISRNLKFWDILGFSGTVLYCLLWVIVVSCFGLRNFRGVSGAKKWCTALLGPYY